MKYFIDYWIFDRVDCFIDKMKCMSKNVTPSVRRTCERIACNPTFFQKLKYK